MCTTATSPIPSQSVKEETPRASGLGLHKKPIQQGPDPLCEDFRFAKCSHSHEKSSVKNSYAVKDLAEQVEVCCT